jgi:hypothetical protein
MQYFCGSHNVSCRHPVAPPERFPSWPGLSRLSTQRRLKDEADIAAISGKGLQTRLSDWVPRFSSFVAPNHVDGRDKPGHDAFFCRRPSFPNSAFPTPQSHFASHDVVGTEAPLRKLHFGRIVALLTRSLTASPRSTIVATKAAIVRRPNAICLAALNSPTRWAAPRRHHLVTPALCRRSPIRWSRHHEARGSAFRRDVVAWRSRAGRRGSRPDSGSSPP